MLNDPGARSVAPVVVADVPLWGGEWDYELERAAIEQCGASFVIPRDAAHNEELITTADIILRGGRRIDAEIIARAEKCVGIVTYSVGLDGIDLDAASAAGIGVRNVPGYCTEEVATHAVLLMLAAMRRLPHWLATTSSGGWLHPQDQLTLPRVSVKTLGVIGAGRIGRAVASRARAFGMTTIAHDPYVDDAVEGLTLVGFDHLLRSADVIVLCASVTSTSPQLLDRAALESLGSPGPIIVNVARGSLIDEQALGEGLRSGRVAAAALDVRASEPPDPANDPLAGAPNLILTPHVAAASREAVDDLRAGVAAAAVDLLRASGRLG
ncbi:MAG TPA: NAD(P)-dependent oxidoreductase [Ilumatobacteraceae bacterium]|nr:NAD(P)-dependent oxidoreductase [Ilumatobacteraceae bacterium]